MKNIIQETSRMSLRLLKWMRQQWDGQKHKRHKNAYRISIGKYLERSQLVSREVDGKTVFSGITRKQNARMWNKNELDQKHVPWHVLILVITAFTFYYHRLTAVRNWHTMLN